MSKRTSIHPNLENLEIRDCPSGMQPFGPPPPLGSVTYYWDPIDSGDRWDYSDTSGGVTVTNWWDSTHGNRSAVLPKSGDTTIFDSTFDDGTAHGGHSYYNCNVDCVTNSVNLDLENGYGNAKSTTQTFNLTYGANVLKINNFHDDGNANNILRLGLNSLSNPEVDFSGSGTILNIYETDPIGDGVIDFNNTSSYTFTLGNKSGETIHFESNITINGGGTVQIGDTTNTSGAYSTFNLIHNAIYPSLTNTNSVLYIYGDGSNTAATIIDSTSQMSKINLSGGTTTLDCGGSSPTSNTTTVGTALNVTGGTLTDKDGLWNFTGQMTSSIAGLTNTSIHLEGNCTVNLGVTGTGGSVTGPILKGGQYGVECIHATSGSPNINADINNCGLYGDTTDGIFLQSGFLTISADTTLNSNCNVYLGASGVSYNMWVYDYIDYNANTSSLYATTSSYKFTLNGTNTYITAYLNGGTSVSGTHTWTLFSTGGHVGGFSGTWGGHSYPTGVGTNVSPAAGAFQIHSPYPPGGLFAATPSLTLLPSTEGALAPSDLILADREESLKIFGLGLNLAENNHKMLA